jgi:hypothetical protein
MLIPRFFAISSTLATKIFIFDQRQTWDGHLPVHDFFSSRTAGVEIGRQPCVLKRLKSRRANERMDGPVRFRAFGLLRRQWAGEGATRKG